MFDALEKSTIRMGDFCDYHFDRDVEKVWGAAKGGIDYFEQRYECRRR